MNGVKYLLGISFSQLTIAENSGDQKFRYCNWFSYFSDIINQNTNSYEKI